MWGKSEDEGITQVVNKTDPAANSQEGKLENWKVFGLGRINGSRKYHGRGWGMISFDGEQLSSPEGG